MISSHPGFRLLTNMNSFPVYFCPCESLFQYTTVSVPTLATVFGSLWFLPALVVVDLHRSFLGGDLGRLTRVGTVGCGTKV